MGDRQENWYDEKNTGCPGPLGQREVSIQSGGVREGLQEEEVFQLNAGEKAGRKRGKERKGCLWWWAQRVEKLASEVCRRNSRHPGRPDLEEDERKGGEGRRPITAQEGRCGRSFRSAPSHWSPAKGSPGTNQRWAPGLGQRQSCLSFWASRARAEGDLPGWLSFVAGIEEDLDGS